MMVPSVWTALVPYEPLPEALGYLHERGWNCFEVSTEHLDWLRLSGDPAGAVELSRRTIEELSLSTPQAHGRISAELAHPDEARRRADMEIIMREFDLCAALGVRNVVLHPGIDEEGCTNRSCGQYRGLVQRNVESFRRLADHAGERGIRIAVENVFDSLAVRGRRAFGATPEELLDLLGAIDRPNVGVCLDTSHANIARLDIPQVIRDFGARLIATHISDSDGSRDQHLIPGHGSRGERKIEWGAVMAAFAEIGYDGIFNLEIPGVGTSELELLDLIVRHACEVAHRLVAMARA
ncbi:MAG: sugar phosphate isomerase/epimerase family protein [Planctomycetota bacterium]